MKINYYDLPLEKELEGKNFNQGLELLKLDITDFEISQSYYRNGMDDVLITDLDCVCTIIEADDTKELLIIYTISDEDSIENCIGINDIAKLNGYWHYADI